MKKLIYVLLLIPIVFSSCKKKGYVDVLYADYWIKNNKPPYEVQFYLDVHYQPDEISYHWDFGDGTTSDEQTPNHLYTKPGKYNVKLQIVNYKTVEDRSFTIDVSQDPMPIYVDFDVESTHGKYFAPSEIKFYNRTQYASDFFWSFGDGRGSSEIEPTHIYDTAGTYNVYLKAFCNGDTATSLYQLVIDPPPSNISVDVVSVWLPDYLLGAEYELHYYTGINEETPINLSTVIANDVPFGWEIGNDLYYFDGVYDNRSLYFEIWDIHNNRAATYSFGVKFSQIQEQFYPDTLSFDSEDGFGAEVLVSYSNLKKTKTK